MLLSTLASCVKAMGGDLKLVVAFPGRKPVELASFADATKAKPRRGTRSPLPRGGADSA